MLHSKLYSQRLDAMAQSGRWRALSNASVLVAGASGMIGSCLVDYLSHLNGAYGAGIDIIALGRNAKRLADRFPAKGDHLTLMAHDIGHPLTSAAPYDYIVHTATDANPKAYAQTPVSVMNANYQGAYNLLSHMRDCPGKAFLFVSSGEVYGVTTNDDGFDEDSYHGIDSMDARACYPLGKLSAEALCSSFASQYGLKTLVARPSHVYGPTAISADTRAVSAFLRNALAREDIVMRSLGTQVRNYCYVTDCVEALLFLLTDGKAREAYNIANEDAVVSIKELAELIAREGGVSVQIQLDDDTLSQGFTKVPRGVLNGGKLRAIGWTARVSLQEGIHETYQILSEVLAGNA